MPLFSRVVEDEDLKRDVAPLFNGCDASGMVIELDDGTLHVSGGDFKSGKVDFDSSKYSFDKILFYQDSIDVNVENSRFDKCGFYVSTSLYLDNCILEECWFEFDEGRVVPQVKQGKLINCTIEEAHDDVIFDDVVVKKNLTLGKKVKGQIKFDKSLITRSKIFGASTGDVYKLVFKECELHLSEIKRAFIQDCETEDMNFLDCHVSWPQALDKSLTAYDSTYIDCMFKTSFVNSVFYRSKFKGCDVEVAIGANNFEIRDSEWIGGSFTGVIVFGETDKTVECDNTDQVFIGASIGRISGVETILTPLTGPMNSENEMIIRAKKLGDLGEKIDPLLRLCGIGDLHRTSILGDLLRSLLSSDN